MADTPRPGFTEWHKSPRTRIDLPITSCPRCGKLVRDDDVHTCSPPVPTSEPEVIRAQIHEAIDAARECQRLEILSRTQTLRADAWSIAENYFDRTSAKVFASVASLESRIAALTQENAAIKKIYAMHCEEVQECVQRFHIGLGGENIFELVTSEVARLTAERDEWREKFNRCGNVWNEVYHANGALEYQVTALEAERDTLKIERDDWEARAKASFRRADALAAENETLREQLSGRTMYCENCEKLARETE